MSLSRPSTVGSGFGRASQASLGGSKSATELPNLPGIRRDISALNPKLYKEFKASRQGSMESLEDDRVPSPAYDAENSLVSYFENPEKFEQFNKSISAFPSQGSAYNDTTGRYSLRSQQADRLSRSRSLPYCSLENAPAFVKHDTHMCRFFAYFEEEAPENLLETRRARNVEICLRVADSTIEICEPSVLNSGLSQGKVLKRHQIPKPDSDGSFATAGPMKTGPNKEVPIYGLRDFHAGATLNIYNRDYHIVDADESTRRYMNEIGIDFGESRPSSSYYWDPALRPGNLRPKKKPQHTIVNLGFYEYERKVLRFYGVWDGRENLFGDDQRVRIHYSLADNKIEVLPINTRNSGRDKQSRLMKKTTITKKAGGAEDMDFPESYSRASTASGIITPEEKWEPDRPYHWKDLFIGAQMGVASLFILLNDADDFTREFYKSKNMPLAPKVDMPVPVYPKLRTYIPPYNPLFGSEEDSLQTCKGSLAGGGPVMKDGAKANKFAGMCMKFLCTLADPKPADETRKFIIQVKLEDDSVQIMEPPQRNSGHKGGTFLSRGKVQMDVGNSGAKKPFAPEDIVVGRIVKIRSHRFVVHDADEFTYKFMEENPNQFEFSDMNLISGKLKQKIEVLGKLILTTPGLKNKQAKYEDLDLLFRKAGCNIMKQEAVTMLRHLDPTRRGNVKMTQVLKFLMS